MKHTERMEDLVVAERAAEWLQRLEQGGPQVHAEFGRWLRESPRHVREVLLASAIQHALKNVNSVGSSRLAEVRARFEDSVVEIELALTRSPMATRGLRPWEPLLSGTARWRNAASGGGWRLVSTFVFMALFAFTAIALYGVSDRTITTVAGEWRNVHLDDGSVLRAGPRTKVSVEMTAQRRLIRLAHGELMVHVARDRARPLYVETELATARAIGTAFAVQYPEADRVSITVQQGTVGVTRTFRGNTLEPGSIQTDSVVLSAGQRTEVEFGGSALRAQSVDLGRELAWVDRKLILDHTIAEAISQLNRLNRDQIRLVDSRFNERRVLGVFDAADPIAFAETITQVLPLSLVDDGHGTLLLVSDPRRTQALTESRSP